MQYYYIKFLNQGDYSMKKTKKIIFNLSCLLAVLLLFLPNITLCNASTYRLLNDLPLFTELEL